MSRRATIIGQVTDHWGEVYDVRERRAGPVDVLIGWPEGQRGRGFGGPQVVVTDDLAAYLRAHDKRGDASLARLPFGGTTLKRVRKLLGLTVDSWWAEREHDLAALAGPAFVAKHGGSESAACLARKRYLGITRQREDGWWLDPDARATLLSERRRIDIADDLGISVGAVGRLRWMIKQEND